MPIVLFHGASEIKKSRAMSDLLVVQSPDDVYYFGSQNRLGIKRENVFSDVTTWVLKIEEIFKDQGEAIRKRGISRSKKLVIILEAHPELGENATFVKLAMVGRHYNLSTWINCEKTEDVPSVIIMNASETLKC